MLSISWTVEISTYYQLTRHCEKLVKQNTEFSTELYDGHSVFRRSRRSVDDCDIHSTTTHPHLGHKTIDRTDLSVDRYSCYLVVFTENKRHTTSTAYFSETMKHAETIGCDILSLGWRMAGIHPCFCDGQKVDMLVSNHIMYQRSLPN